MVLSISQQKAPLLEAMFSRDWSVTARFKSE